MDICLQYICTIYSHKQVAVFALNTSTPFVCLLPSNTSNRWLLRISKRISNSFHAVRWMCAGKWNSGIKHWTEQHLNINIKGLPFYTLNIWVFVELMNKGIFSLVVWGKEESIIQNKSCCCDAVWCMTPIEPQILDDPSESVHFASWGVRNFNSDTSLCGND